MIGLILRNSQNNKCVSIHKIIQLIVMKTKLKMKKRSLKYEINGPRPRHGHKYNNYKYVLVR